MRTKACYYDVLSVDRDSDAAELKRAYRKLALQLHPDRNPGDEEAEDRFKEASEAYQVLSDPEKRRAYDTYGHEGVSGQGFGGPSSFHDIFSQFGDIFGDIFGGGGPRGPRRGADLRYAVELDFEQAAFGLDREITFARREDCDTCEGSGARPGTSPIPCGTCQGQGKVTRQQGFFMVQTTCPVCRGAGHVITDRCDDCGGAGVAAVERTVNVHIPAGVDDGMRLRVSGEGEAAGPGTVRGDLYVVVHVADHAHFQRDGSDVHLERVISLTQAALGDSVLVDTLHGDAEITIPPGTQPGTVARLRDKGIPRLDRPGRGDQYVVLRVAVPEELDDGQRRLLEQLRDAGL